MSTNFYFLFLDGRIFVTLGGFDGNPASLATVSNILGNSGPLLTPYPNWTLYNTGSCRGITNVYRIAVILLLPLFFNVIKFLILVLLKFLEI